MKELFGRNDDGEAMPGALAPRKPAHPGMDPGLWCLVRAAAGSGKTHLLVRRLLRIAMVESQPTRFLAVTFTNKAAAEMKSRLLLVARDLLGPKAPQLCDELGLSLRDPKVAGFYWSLLDNFSRVRVSTIHAFCNEVVTRFGWECGIAPQVKVLDSVSRQRLRDVCMDRFLNSPHWQDPHSDLGGALEQLRSDGVRASAIPWRMTAVENSCNLWRAWLLSTMQGVDLDDVDPLLSSAFAEHSLVPSPIPAPELPDAALLLASDRWGELLDHLRGGASGRSKKKDEIAEELAAALQARDAKLLIRAASGLERLAGQNDAKWKQLVTRAEAYSAARALWLPALMAKGSLTARAWATVSLHYLRELQAAKRTMGVIDFSDMEWIASMLLTRDLVPGLDQYILFCLSQLMRHMALDEFQDTSDLQWSILGSLADLLSGSDTGMPGSAFCVGDIKQSIYRFRHAEPELMNVAASHLRGLAEIAGRPFAELNLARSYRSTPAVLRFVEAMFQPAREPALPLPHGEDGAVEGARQGAQGWGKVVVEPHFSTGELEADEAVAGGSDAGVAGQDDGDGEGAMPTPLERRARLGKDEVMEGSQRCADWCSQLVASLVTEQEPVYDGALGGWRPAAYGDILVLLETRTHAERFEAAFRRGGIPFVASGRGTMGARIEFTDFMTLVRWLLRPMDDLAFVGLLRSPLFRIPDETLLELRRRSAPLEASKSGPGVAKDLFRSNWRNSGRLPSFWQVMQKRFQEGVLGPELTQALPALDEVQRCWRASPSELFVTLEKRFGLIGRYGAVFNPGVEANFRLFWSKAVELEASGTGSIWRFYDELLTLAAGEEFSDAPLPATDDAGMVRFMTVHGAKGLEAPIVILPDSARKSSMGRSGDILTVRSGADLTITGVVHDMGSAYPVSRSELPWPSGVPEDRYVEAKTKEEQRSRDEQACLAYVAVTRARDHLYIGGFGAKVSADEEKQPAATLHSEAMAAMRWLEESGVPSGQTPLVLGQEQTENNQDDGLGIRYVLESGTRPAQLLHPLSSPAARPCARGPLAVESTVLFEEEVGSKATDEGDVSKGSEAAEASHAKGARWQGASALKRQEEAIAYGNALHALMEAVSRYGVSTLGQWASGIAGRFLPLDQVDSLVEEVTALYDDSSLKPFLAGPGLNELPLVLQHSARRVRMGIPDRICQVNGAWCVIDFKTQRNVADVPQSVRDQYAEQLRFYCQMLRKIDLPEALPGAIPGAISGAIPAAIPAAIPGAIPGAIASAIPLNDGQPPIRGYILWTRTRQLDLTVEL